jgi:flagellar L-ring protein precursor FlgH
MLVAVVGLFVLFNNVGADSLWERRNPYFANMFWDTRARRVGDVLTILLNESTLFDGRDTRMLEKDTKAQANVNLAMSYTAGKATTRNFQGNFSPEVDSLRQLNGKGNYTSNRTLTDRMSVVVIAVEPNGNLVIEGYRTRVIANEERTMRVSGIVKPTDIGFSNTVLSQFIANFTVEYIGKGPESSYTNNGWLGRCMNKLWPF